jgi:type IV pilus assembly protein PilF
MSFRMAAILAQTAVLVAALTACSVGPAPLADWVTESDLSDAQRRASLRLDLASAYLQQGQATVALDEVKQALRLAPDLPAAWNLRGLVYVQLGDPARAEASFERALALAPSDADAAHNHGWLLCRPPHDGQRNAQAQALLRRALAQSGYPHAARSWLVLAQCQQQAGQLDPAAASLIEVARRQVGDAQTLWHGARLARRLDNEALLAQFGRQLRERFGRSPELAAFEKGAWDE